jgi:LysM repeat protein
LSLAANVTFGVALVSLYRSARNLPREAESNTVLFATNTPFRVAKTNIILNPRVFRWQEIESTNYALYVMNLRGIGGPESTVRDIIVADVNEFYARRRRELDLTMTNDMAWWRSEPDPETLRGPLAKVKALEEERNALLTRLLGPNWDQTTDLEPEPVLLSGPVLSALTSKQKEAVQEVAAHSRQLLNEYVREREKEGEMPDRQELAQMRERTRRELEELLTPEQLEEFLLRYSNNANQLRDELRGFNASPSEFRQVFLATDAIDRQLQLLPDDNDPATADRRKDLEQQREEAIRQAVGSDRYDTYRFLKDADYRLAVTEAEEAGADARAGKVLYEINRAAALERERIRNDPSLGVAQKEQELKVVEQQRTAWRATALGLEAPPDSTSTPTPPVFRHTTVPGESLPGLALYYRVPLNEMMKANPGMGFDNLQPGQEVKIPEQIPSPRLTPTIPPR